MAIKPVILIFALMTTIATSSEAAMIRVPSQRTTIQAGINAATNGDTVLVADGHYHERITFLGKAITVSSNIVIDGDTLHVAKTIIDGDTTVTPFIFDTGCVVRMVNGEDSTTSLIGFTIQHGASRNGRGGGILCSRTNNDPPFTAPKIQYCSIIDNKIPGGTGGGIWASSGVNVNIIHSVFRRNEPDGFWGSMATVRGCVFDSNLYAGIFQVAGLVRVDSCSFLHNSYGITQAFQSNPSGTFLSNCSFQNNGSGAKIWYYSGTVTNCKFAGNTVGLDLSHPPTAMLEKAALRPLSNITVDSCDFSGNGEGLYLMEYGFDITRSRFSNNTTAVAIQVDAEVYLSGCQFFSNGYAIFAHEANNLTSISNCEFSRNSLGALHNAGNLTCTNTVFAGNSGEAFSSYAAHAPRNSAYSSCTFLNNSITSGALINATGDSLLLSSCIISFNQSTEIAACHTIAGQNAIVAANCTDIFANSSQSWGGNLAGQDTFKGNLTENPLFCDTAGGIFSIEDVSPCAPAHNSCHSLIGALGVNCSNVAPSGFSLLAPSNAVTPPLATLLPTVSWTTSTDSDSNDAVRYDLLISSDSVFGSSSQIAGVASNSCSLTDKLSWQTRYWWKVKAYDLHGAATWSAQTFTFRTMTVGDGDGNGTINISDVVLLIHYMFAGGTAPDPLLSADANCDLSVNITDAVMLIQYIFAGGPAPRCS